MLFTKTNPPQGYYVYSYIRSSDLTPYYIGKGKNKRAWIKHHVSVPKDESKIVIIQHSLTEESAFDLEKQLISEYGRKDNNTGILHNKTDGGDGSSGRKHSTKTREKMSAAAKKRTPWNKGKTGLYSEEYKAKMSSSRKGKIPWNKGKTGIYSAESLAKMSSTAVGRIVSEETRKKMSIAHKKK